VFWALIMLGCGTPGTVEAEVPAEPLAAAVYSDGMWSERVLTVAAGLDEALGKLDAGDAAAAAELCGAVYRHSFEPELEPLTRARLGRASAAGTEYGFGLVRSALADGDTRAARAQRDALVRTLTAQAAELDAARAVLRD
jgi:hypothetical protein